MWKFLRRLLGDNNIFKLCFIIVFMDIAKYTNFILDREKYVRKFLEEKTLPIYKLNLSFTSDANNEKDKVALVNRIGPNKVASIENKIISFPKEWIYLMNGEFIEPYYYNLAEGTSKDLAFLGLVDLIDKKELEVGLSFYSDFNIMATKRLEEMFSQEKLYVRKDVSLENDKLFLDFNKRKIWKG